MQKRFVAFDFDKTIIYLSDVHRKAWEQILQKADLEPNLDAHLPEVLWLNERFDSENRVKQHLLSDKNKAERLKAHYNQPDSDKLAELLVQQKEAHALAIIDSMPASNLSARLGHNLKLALHKLQKNNCTLGIISSARESVIKAVLDKTKTSYFFCFVVGEDSLRDKKGILHDKPDAFGLSRVPQKFIRHSSDFYYVGDDIRVDSAFARNCKLNFVQVEKTTDFKILVDCIL
ncbi:MAG: HAD hydrolase-like protein [Candidatus Woesebacteria bacterium]|jgi:phosphoglycolate phosphatase-like HAD superfamily hydrolase